MSVLVLPGVTVSTSIRSEYASVKFKPRTRLKAFVAPYRHDIALGTNALLDDMLIIADLLLPSLASSLGIKACETNDYELQFMFKWLKMS